VWRLFIRSEQQIKQRVKNRTSLSKKPYQLFDFTPQQTRDTQPNYASMQRRYLASCSRRSFSSLGTLHNPFYVTSSLRISSKQRWYCTKDTKEGQHAAEKEDEGLATPAIRGTLMSLYPSRVVNILTTKKPRDLTNSVWQLNTTAYIFPKAVRKVLRDWKTRELLFNKKDAPKIEETKPSEGTANPAAPASSENNPTHTP
jgi:hypothetical protein